MTIGSDSDESVGDGDLVKVRVLPVEEEGVRSPDFLQKLPVHCQLIDQIRLVELQSLVIPILPAQICIIKRGYFVTFSVSSWQDKWL